MVFEDHQVFAELDKCCDLRPVVGVEVDEICSVPRLGEEHVRPVETGTMPRTCIIHVRGEDTVMFRYEVFRMWEP